MPIGLHTLEQPLFFTAASVGASHRRERVFILAYRQGEHGRSGLGSFGRTRRGLEYESDSGEAFAYRAGGRFGELRGTIQRRRTAWTGATAMWPTPNTMPEAPNGGLDRGDGIRARTTDQCLANRALQWPTPHGFQNNNGPDGNEFSTAVRQWTTPVATDRANRGNRARKIAHMAGGESNLADDVANWPTPAARDNKSGQASDATMERNARPLNEIAERYSPPAQATPAGPASLPKAPGSRRRLNPNFVENLMGVPLGWTIQGPIRLRCLGNSVVPLQAAIAFVNLAIRAGLIHSS